MSELYSADFNRLNINLIEIRHDCSTEASPIEISIAENPAENPTHQTLFFL